MGISQEDIKRHIKEIAKGQEGQDGGYRLVFEDFKNAILNHSKYGKLSNNTVLEFIDREIENTTKYSENLKISDSNINKIADYLFNHIFNISAPLFDAKEELAIAIKERIINNSLEEVYPIEKIYPLTVLLENLIIGFQILEMQKQDESKIIIDNRQHKKIEEARDLLLTYTDDIQTKYYLNNIKPSTKSITKETLLPCLFYLISKNIESFLSNKKRKSSKQKIADIANQIIREIFESKIEYRIYPYTKNITYKSLTLTKYTPKK